MAVAAAAATRARVLGRVAAEGMLLAVSGLVLLVVARLYEGHSLLAASLLLPFLLRRHRRRRLLPKGRRRLAAVVDAGLLVVALTVVAAAVVLSASPSAALLGRALVGGPRLNSSSVAAASGEYRWQRAAAPTTEHAEEAPLVLDRGSQGAEEPPIEPRSTARAFKQLLRLLLCDGGPEGRLFGFGLSFLFLAAWLKAAIPEALSLAVSMITKATESDAGRVVFQGNVIRLLMLGTGAALISALRAMFMGTVTAKLLHKLRSRVYSSILAKDLAWHDEHEVGALSSRVNADCAAVSESLTIYLNVFLRSSLSVLLSSRYLIRTSWLAIGGLLPVWLVIFTVTRMYGIFAKHISAEKQDKSAELGQAVSEDFGLIRVLRAYGLEDRQTRRFERLNSEVERLDVRRYLAYAGFLFVVSLVMHFAPAATVAGGYALISRGSMSSQQLMASLIHVHHVVEGSVDAVDYFTSLQQTAGKARWILDILDSDAEDVQDVPKGLALAELVRRGNLTIPDDEFRGHIELRNVTFTYPGRSQPALRCMNLEIPAGKTVALVGSSGSGKSTVAALVQQFYVAQLPSEIFLDGRPLMGLNKDWLRSQMAVVTQDPRLFADTVFNNIAVGVHGLARRPDGDELRHRVWSAAAAANAHDFIMALPQGYGTRVGDLKLLSGGQRQRIAIARALMRQPKILILDEATSALDSESEASVQAAIDTILDRGHMTCIIIAHRLSTVKRADRVAVLDAGRVVETGTFSELLHRPGGRLRRAAAEQGIRGSWFPSR